MSVNRALCLAALLGVLVACQAGQGGFAARKCEEDGHKRDTAAFKKCVDRAYAIERARAERYRGP